MRVTVVAVSPRAARRPAAAASSGVAPRAIALATAAVRCSSIFLLRLFVNQLQIDIGWIFPMAGQPKPVTPSVIVASAHRLQAPHVRPGGARSRPMIVCWSCQLLTRR